MIILIASYKNGRKSRHKFHDGTKRTGPPFHFTILEEKSMKKLLIVLTMMLALGLAAMGSPALAEDGTIPAPTCVLPEVLQAGEELTVSDAEWMMLNQDDSLGFTIIGEGYIWSLYRLAGGEWDYIAHGQHLLYEDELSFTIAPEYHEYIVSGYGFDAGSYLIEMSHFIVDENYSRLESETREYNLTVTGSRPAAPTVTVNPGTFYIGSSIWFDIQAPGMTKYAVMTYDENGTPEYVYPYEVSDSSGTERYWDSAQNPESHYYRVSALVDGRWSAWSDMITLTWVSLGTLELHEEDLTISGTSAGAPLVLTVNGDILPNRDYSRHLLCNLYRIEDGIRTNVKSWIYIYGSSLNSQNQKVLEEYGLDAGDYVLEAKLEEYHYISSAQLSWNFSVTGSRPTPPETRLLTESALLSQPHQIQLSAEGMETYRAEYKEPDDSRWSEDYAVQNPKISDGSAVYQTSVNYGVREMSYRFRAKIGGRWSDYTNPVTLTWSTAGSADPISITAPAQISAGAPLTVSLAEVQSLAADETLQVNVYDEEGSLWESREYADLAADETLTVAPYGLDPGQYRIEALRQKTNYENSEATNLTLTVTGARPALPAVSPDPAEVYSGEYAVFTVTASGLESVGFQDPYEGEDTDIWMAVGGRAVIKLRVSWSREQPCRALVNGRWTDEFNLVIDVQETPEEARLAAIVPDLEGKTITVGEDFTFDVSVDPRTETFTVGIVLIEETDGSYNRLREIEYEMVTDVVNGKVTLPASKFPVPGMYVLNFNAYADGFNSAWTDGYNVLAVDAGGAAQPVSATVTPQAGENWQINQDLPVLIEAPGASRVALKVIHKESETSTWSNVVYFDDAISLTDGQAQVVVDGYDMDAGYYSFYVMTCADGHWSQWQAAATFQANAPESGMAQLPALEITEYPDLITCGEPFTVRWSASEGAEKYVVFYRISDSSLLAGTVTVSGDQTEATLTVPHVDDVIVSYDRCGLYVHAIAAGMEQADSDWVYVDVIDSVKPTLSPGSLSVGLNEHANLTVSGLRANEMRIRINGADRGYMDYNAGNLALSFSEAGSYQVQVSVRYCPGTYRYGLWSGWSDPVTVTVANEWPAAPTLTLPDDTITIGDEAFRGTDSTYVVINSGCTAIGNLAFANCPNLTRVTIPASVTSISGNPFAGCGTVVIVTPEGSTADQFAAQYGFPTQR